MDGNGRWAKLHALPKISGHRKGAEIAKKIILHAQKRKIQYLTLYTFSSENWGRPLGEINNLMSLIKYYVSKERESLNKHNIKVKIIGDLTKVSNDLRSEIDEVVSVTADNTGLTLVIAFSYGSRDEILYAVRSIAKLYKSQEISLNDLTVEKFSSYLDTCDIPDPDLLIRTSGEYRISNFLLWQLAYTEFYFTNVHWPDFIPEELDKALIEFGNRERRYGK